MRMMMKVISPSKLAMLLSRAALLRGPFSSSWTPQSRRPPISWPTAASARPTSFSIQAAFGYPIDRRAVLLKLRQQST